MSSQSIEILKNVCGNGAHININPTLAKMILELPMHPTGTNRPVSHGAIAQYARDMSMNRWQKSHSPIVIGKNNVLINGQHRLKAIVDAGVSVTMFVVFDDDYESPRDYLGDEGVKRTASYSLGITTSESSAAREIISICSSNTNPTKYEIGEVWKRLEPVWRKVVRGSPSTRGVTQTTFVLAVIAAAIRHNSYDYCSDVFTHMVDGRVQDIPPYPFSIYKQIVIDNTKYKRREILARVYRAFNIEMKNKSKVQVKDIETLANEATNILNKHFMLDNQTTR